MMQPTHRSSIQINGKMRDKILVPVGTSQEAINALALGHDKVVAELKTKQLRKVIPVPGRLVNIVIG